MKQLVMAHQQLCDADYPREVCKISWSLHKPFFLFNTSKSIHQADYVLKDARVLTMTCYLLYNDKMAIFVKAQNGEKNFLKILICTNEVSCLLWLTYKIANMLKRSWAVFALGLKVGPHHNSHDHTLRSYFAFTYIDMCWATSGATWLAFTMIAYQLY